MTFSIKDSNLEGEVRGWEAAGIIDAIEKLRKQFLGQEVQLLHLNNYTKADDIDCPLWYNVERVESRGRGSRPIVTSARFFSSHYIGSYCLNNTRLEILPRFGEDVFNHILGYACNLYIPKGYSSYALSGRNNDWLIGILWKALLDRALTKGQIPKGYNTITENLKHYRGHLNIQRHIKANLVDESRFFCTYRKLSMDITINRAIRYTYKILQEKGLGDVLKDLSTYDSRLASFGVSDEAIGPSELDNIAYSSLNDIYRPVMRMSRAIISNSSAESSSEGNKTGISYFLDVAELWELYLIKVLQKGLGSEYRVYSPNSLGGSFLLDDGIRSLRPDIIIERAGKIIMIIDAKYKRYNEFGVTSDAGISREDLYQMNSYIYHLGNPNEPIIGLFTSPASPKQKQDIHSYSHNKKHRVGLVNLNLDDAQNYADIKRNEGEYISIIRSLLES